MAVRWDVVGCVMDSSSGVVSYRVMVRLRVMAMVMRVSRLSFITDNFGLLYLH
jgi:hypothetical protein